MLAAKKQRVQDQIQTKSAAVQAKMVRIEQLAVKDAKTLQAEKKKKLQQLAEQTKLIRQSLKARPQTAQPATKPDNRAFI